MEESLALKTLLTIRGEPVLEHTDGRVTFSGGMTINGDGSPRCYGPPGTNPLDYLANAGYHGNWWGIATRNGAPIIQGPNDPYPGYYVSTTALQHRNFPLKDTQRYINSEKVPFIVVPSPLIRAVRGIVLGCKATVQNKFGTVVEGIVADIGPAAHLGEVSIYMADKLGVSSNPKSGGSRSKEFEYTFWPGIPVEINGIKYKLQSS